jgi:hypothetical protein
LEKNAVVAPLDGVQLFEGSLKLILYMSYLDERALSRTRLVWFASHAERDAR